MTGTQAEELENHRANKREQDFLRTEIIRLHGRISNRTHSDEDLDRLSEFLLRAHRDSAQDYHQKAVKAYRRFRRE